MRKGKEREARLSFMGLALMENGNGLLMDFMVSSATGTAEREAVPVRWTMPGSGATVPRRWEGIRATTRGSASELCAIVE